MVQPHTLLMNAINSSRYVHTIKQFPLSETHTKMYKHGVSLRQGFNLQASRFSKSICADLTYSESNKFYD